MTGSMEIYPEKNGRNRENFWKLNFPDTVMLILVSVQSGFTEKIPAGAVPEELYKMTLEKIMRNLIGEYKPVYVFMNRYQDAVGMIGGYKGETENLQEIISEKINKTVDGKCCVLIQTCKRDEIPDVHEKLRTRARKILECRPIVMEARKYIYAHYQQRELDLTQVADAIGCNPSYLSRIMKQELGISFKDFLTMLRISQAISLMRNDRLSLNQIAEQVGYSNQHYFSAAFKNCQGFSPSEFRRTLTREE
ncbi:MAG: helix-turn-helix domain-containing protein [Blautia caecimuris]